jgi:1-acyl-sn-glycerol-3-phosphate acyltransferase
MREFKDGVAYIAIKAGVPVIPFAIRGTREVLPIGSIEVRGGTVDLIFGEPIPTEGYHLKDRARLTQVVFGRVSELLARAEGAASASARAESRVA